MVPFTEAVCDGKAGEGHVHREICSNFLDEIGKFQLIFGVGIRAPLCMEICFHSCDAEYVGGQDHDSYTHCKREECATSDCLSFLLRECSPIQHAAINAQYQRICTLAPPSPPAPPFPPPTPPRAPNPRPPPPALKYAERFRDTELDSDVDCELVAFDICQEIVRRFAAENSGYSSHLLVTTSTCEGTDVESDCFLGCAFGSKSGGTYRFTIDEENAFTRRRCAMSEHPRCACANSPSPPPTMFAPPPPLKFTEDWYPVQLPNDRDTTKGAVSAIKQRLVNGRTMDLSLRTGPMHAYQCFGEDDGSETCALTCAAEHLSRLRAFTVTGESYLPPPPPPPPSAPPPRPPPPFVFNDTDGTTTFDGCSTACTEDVLLCRDGGHGSFSPALCAYSTQCIQCGVRGEIGRTGASFPGDDSCAYARDGLCQDGRPSTPEKESVFVTLGPGQVTHLCGAGTDATDCGPFTIDTVSDASYSASPRQPSPLPPPPPPPSPAPSPPKLVACNKDDVCPFTQFCSDGGINSQPTGSDAATGKAMFACDLGTQCSDELCPPRDIQNKILCSDSCLRDSIQGRVKWTGQSRNGICEDGGDPTSMRRNFSAGYMHREEDNVYIYYNHEGGCGYGKLHMSNSNPTCSSRARRPLPPPCAGVNRNGLQRLWPSSPRRPRQVFDRAAPSASS